MYCKSTHQSPTGHEYDKKWIPWNNIYSIQPPHKQHKKKKRKTDKEWGMFYSFLSPLDKGLYEWWVWGIKRYIYEMTVTRVSWQKCHLIFVILSNANSSLQGSLWAGKWHWLFCQSWDTRALGPYNRKCAVQYVFYWWADISHPYKHNILEWAYTL